MHATSIVATHFGAPDAEPTSSSTPRRVRSCTSRHCARVRQMRLRRVSDPVTRSVRQILRSSCGVCSESARATCSPGAWSGAAPSPGGAASAPVAINAAATANMRVLPIGSP
jgi:hypothetical protein